MKNNIVRKKRFFRKRLGDMLVVCISTVVVLGCKDGRRGEATDLANVVQETVFVTIPDGTFLFQEQKHLLTAYQGEPVDEVLTVNDSKTYQDIDGFGYTLTGGSALHIQNMTPTARETLLQEVFGTGTNDIGVSYLRVSIGASDLDAEPFSYNDLPKGQTDVHLDHFTLERDKIHLIPLLKQILNIAPDIKILGSVWSPPVWMKTNGSTIGGSLKPEYYGVYAQYFAKYIEEMKKEGIVIDAITIQNEPLHPHNNPSLLMLATEQADFIKNHLGPVFKSKGIETKIIIYDHNADLPEYPISILDDPETAQYVDGSAFHLYGGEVSTLSTVHNAHPTKHLYFTEQWVGAQEDPRGVLSWHIEHVIIGTLRHWSRTALEWNLAADAQQKPHTEGGCTECLGALTITGNEVTRNPAYYSIAHASKWIRPGALRVASNEIEGIPNVVFKTPQGNWVAIIQNKTQQDKKIKITTNAKNKTVSLPAEAIATVVF